MYNDNNKRRQAEILKECIELQKDVNDYTTKIDRDIFDINYIDTSYEKIKEIKEKWNISIITADMNGEILDTFQKPSSNFAIAIGNEGQGISSNMVSLSDNIVSIPMENNVESLNASISASILMYLLK